MGFDSYSTQQDELKKYKNVRVSKTSLSKEQEEHLREAFAGQDVEVTL